MHPLHHLLKLGAWVMCCLTGGDADTPAPPVMSCVTEETCNLICMTNKKKYGLFLFSGTTLWLGFWLKEVVLLSRVFTCIIHMCCLTLHFQSLSHSLEKYVWVTRVQQCSAGFCWNPSSHHYCFYLNKALGSQRLIILQQCLWLTFNQVYVFYFLKFW